MFKSTPLTSTIRFFRRHYIALLFVLLLPTVSSAFDDNRTISDVDLRSETFLDLNAHSFRRSLEKEWLHAENGVRITGGSISSNRLFMDSELRLKQILSDQLSVSLNMEQEEFYSDKPLPRPLLSVDVYPIDHLDLGLSILGTAAHDKRQADLGYALSWGRAPQQFMRFSWMRVDFFHNEKNEFDDTVYEEAGETLALEGYWPINDRWELAFDFKEDTPLIITSESEDSRFAHKRVDHEVSLYFLQSAERLWGSKIRQFNLKKSLANQETNTGQGLGYKMVDLFYVRTLDNADELTFGVRHDAFKEDLYEATDDRKSFDFNLKTTQVYASWHHQFSAQQSWDLGVYTGWSKRDKIYLRSGLSFNEKEEGVESKFRGSWEYQSQDGKSALGLSLTLNLDDLINDPGDGGGMYFRSVF